jgi:DNA-binding transcriptional ArsR family regulator
VSDDPALGDLLDVLSDDYAREILAATSVSPMSAYEIAEKCDMSPPTVYRRIERLQAFGLVDEETRVEPNGNDYKVYSATLRKVSLSLDEGTFEAVVDRAEPEEAFPGANEDDPADRFKKMWEGL